MVRRRPLAALSALTCAAASGCWPCCQGTLSTTSNADLLESESSATYAIQMDAGDIAQAFENVGVVGVNTTVNFPDSAEPGSCIEVTSESSPVSILFDCPPDAGSFSLPDLSATVCDDIACATLQGTVNVHSFTPECAAQDCGHLEADLTLPVSPADGGPSVSGTANLYYDHSSQAGVCSLQLPSED